MLAALHPHAQDLSPKRPLCFSKPVVDPSMLDVQGHLMLWGDPGQWPTSSTVEEQGRGRGGRSQCPGDTCGNW